ncbi:PfkB family carbohydrate kinase [Sphingomonas sp. BK235]|uniref:PfkB family carbohydrate kinase n=1 Tax=Sphingomonas sp. BK235 TaxID=2512131 RepID=UPI001047EF5F|nr:PfkB family carbohydrate kinase [Sphingomonas sp. BK235]TCP31039.1 fructoselysine 6-kinase [Sphingomonas sp. BK235]
MRRILGLGDNTVDTYVDHGLQYPGGNAVNVAVMAARLGAATGYLGCVGEDEGGALVHTSLLAEGVDVARLRTRAGANARAFIGHVDGDRQFLRTEPGVRADYRWEDADFAYMAQYDHVHTSIYSQLDDVLPLVARAVPSVSIDGSNRWSVEWLARVLPHVRIVFLSAADVPSSELDALITHCLRLGPEAVVATRGGAGAVGATKDQRLVQAALPTEVVDTLGAGDGFISGFLVSYLSGASLRYALGAGAAYAARVCTWHGGYGHDARWTGDVAVTAAGQ